MRKCFRCKKKKKLEDFRPNKSKPSGYDFICKPCWKIYAAEWHQKNKKSHNIAIHANSKRYEHILREFVYEYLSTHPCIDCGETNIVVLEFDHLENKLYAISNLLRLGAKLGRLEAEIAKCEVRCSNCHTIVEAERHDHWKLRWQKMRSTQN